MEKNFNYSVVKDIGKPISTEPLVDRLCRLAATFHGSAVPVGPTQSFFYENRTVAYEGMSPLDALYMFVQECKLYQKEQVLCSSLEGMRRHSAIGVAPTYLRSIYPPVKGKPSRPAVIHKIVFGDIAGTVTADQLMARTVADVLTVHSTCEKKAFTDKVGVSKEQLIVKDLTEDQCNLAYLYPMDVRTVRTFYCKEGASNQTTRDLYYQEMATGLVPAGDDGGDKAKKTRAHIMMLMDMLASQVKLIYRTPFSKEDVEFFNIHKPAIMDKKTEMWKFSYANYKNMTGVTEHNKAWRGALFQWQHTGAGKENIFAGYSLLDCTPGFAKHLEEAIDIVNVAQAFGYEAVTLTHANLVLSEILVASGLSVYNMTHGQGIQGRDDPPRIYYSGALKQFTWYHSAQKRPEIKGETINMPPDVQFFAGECFGYAYIPAMKNPEHYYYPSIRAASGLCIATNVNITHKCNITISQLISRFFAGVCCRSQYIYTRVTFPMVDPMRHFFTAVVILPQINQEQTKLEGLDAMAEYMSALKFDPDSLKDMDEISKTRYDFVTDTFTYFSPEIPSGTRVSAPQMKENLKTLLRKEARTISWFSDVVWALDHNIPLNKGEVADYVSTMLRKDALAVLLDCCSQLKSVTTLKNGTVSKYHPGKIWNPYLDREKAEAKKKIKEKPPPDVKKTPPPVPPSSGGLDAEKSSEVVIKHDPNDF